MAKKTNLYQQGIVILDFGSQYNQLIARRIRELGIYTEILPYNTPLSKIKARNPKGIILSGGPSSVYKEFAHLISTEIFELNAPLLGICYGMQLITHFARVGQGGTKGYHPGRITGKRHFFYQGKRNHSNSLKKRLP